MSGLSPWSTESPGVENNLKEGSASGQCGRRGAEPQFSRRGAALIGPDMCKYTISVYPDILKYQERYPYILDTISVYPDIAPDIIGDIVLFLHDIGDFPISRQSRHGNSEISGLISGVLSQYRVKNPVIAPVKKGVTIS